MINKHLSENQLPDWLSGDSQQASLEDDQETFDDWNELYSWKSGVVSEQLGAALSKASYHLLAFFPSSPIPYSPLQCSQPEEQANWVGLYWHQSMR